MVPLEIILNTVIGIALFIYWMAAFIILYHLTRFGIGVQPKRLSAIFLLGSIVLTGVVLVLATSLDISALNF